MANYYMYDPEKPGTVYPMKADKTKSVLDILGGKNPNAKGKRRCPKCARRMSKRKQVCKCGYTKPVVPSQRAYRVFALFFLVFAALAVAVIPCYFVNSLAWTPEVNSFVIELQKGSLLSMLTGGMTQKIFGKLPAFSIGFGGETSFVYTLSAYVFAICAVLAVVCSLFALLSREKAAKRISKALLFMGIGALAYSVSFTVCLNTFETAYEALTTIPSGALYLKASKYVFDFVSAFTGVACLIASFVVSKIIKRPAKLEKKAAKKEAKKAKKCK